MKQIQIPEQLFMELVKFHLLDMEENLPSIKQGLEAKLDALVMRDLFQNTKLRPQRKNGNRREKNIWTNEECRRNSGGNSSLMIETGASHAPVNNR